MPILQLVTGVAGKALLKRISSESVFGRKSVIVGRMPFRKAPAIISVDAKVCLLFPVGSWHPLDSPGTGQKMGTLYRR